MNTPNVNQDAGCTSNCSLWQGSSVVAGRLGSKGNGDRGLFVDCYWKGWDVSKLACELVESCGNEELT